jgi:hypothetical protein
MIFVFLKKYKYFPLAKNFLTSLFFKKHHNPHTDRGCGTSFGEVGGQKRFWGKC